MDLAPPVKNAKPTKESIAQLDDWLQSITAYHPATEGRPWTFYEKVDEYLGPWKDRGYPIAYGKKYCKLFYEDKPLNSNEAGRRWVQRTLLLLQDALRKFIVEEFKAGRLSKISEEQLKAAAFASHSQAYTEGGLTMVALLSPHLVPYLATIPRVEFLPTSPNFGPTAEQFVDTAGVVINQSVAAILGLFGGPAHTQMLRYGAASDQLREANNRLLALRLAHVRDKIRAGSCDHTDLLNRLEIGISKTVFAESGANNMAALVVSDIKQRKTVVKMRYLKEVGKDPLLKEVFKAYDPAGCRW